MWTTEADKYYYRRVRQRAEKDARARNKRIARKANMVHESRRKGR